MRISIVICNYNYARFVEMAIRSALDQDYPDTEVIVVDDGSTDDSKAIIDRWRPAIRVVYKTNGGQPSAYNAGFEQVTGDVVVFLDSDDMLDRGACSVIAEGFTGGAVKVHFRLRLVDTEGKALGAAIPRVLAEGNVADRLRLRGELYDSAPGSGNAYRVEALRRLAPLPEYSDDLHAADFFVCYGISLLGDVHAAGTDPLGSYRVHVPMADSLIFGNATPDSQGPFRLYRRYERMNHWVTERLGEKYALPRAAPDFSIEKQGYAVAIFSAGSYFRGIRLGTLVLFSKLIPAIHHQKGSAIRKAGLTGWAVAILLLPRSAGFPLARYVCNPVSRVVA